MKSLIDVCVECDGDGYIESESSDYGLRIERCDECCKYEDDAQAVEAYRRAGGALRNAL